MGAVGVAAAGKLSGRISGRPYMPAVLALVVLLGAALAGCGSASTAPRHDLPGGVYINTAYHFRVTYPQGWQLNVAPQSSSSQISPLALLITRSGELQSNASLVSTFGVTVFDASASPIATAVAGYAADTTLHPLTLSGLPAYQGTPVQQAVPSTQFSDTHTDYYLIHGGYEYRLSTDSVQGDNASAALDSMLKSFTILS